MPFSLALSFGISTGAGAGAGAGVVFNRNDAFLRSVTAPEIPFNTSYKFSGVTIVVVVCFNEDVEGVSFVSFGLSLVCLSSEGTSASG